MNQIHAEREFIERMEAVLMRNNCHEDPRELNELAEIIVSDECRARAKVPVYKWMGLTALMLIPIISAVISIATTSQVADANPGQVAGGEGWLGIAVALPFLSILLTVLTILNSSFHPAERFSACCQLLIGIDRFKFELVRKLDELLAQPDVQEKAKLPNFVHDKRDEFVRYQLDAMRLFLPELPGTTNGDNKGPQRNEPREHERRIFPTSKA
jgi:hypothetical protein